MTKAGNGPGLPAGLLALTVALSGCTITPGHTVNPTSSRDQDRSEVAYRVLEVTPSLLAEIEAFRSERALSQRAPGLRSLAELRQDGYQYRVGPGDIIQVTVWEHPELTNPGNELRTDEAAGRLIDSDGVMFFPYVGAFRAEGMRIADLRDHISDNLRRVIREPQVDVRVISHRSQRVYVTGEVAAPGVVHLDDVPRGILDVVNERGGLTERASNRMGTISRNGETVLVNLHALYASGLPEHNIALEPGDVVHVPDNSEEKVFVLGEAKREGPVPIGRHRMTLTEALAAAEGIEPLSARDSGVFVFRSGAWMDMSIYAGEDMPSDEALVFALDMSRVDGFLLADRFELLPRDVVYVASTGFARYNRVIQQILPTVSTLFQLDRLVSRR